MKKHAAILLMAGSGTRLGGPCPKQFLELMGKPLYIHSLERFCKCGFDQICLVCPKDHIKKISTDYDIVQGGKTRQESVLMGLNALRSNIEIVTIHDSARALASTKLIEEHKQKGQIYTAISTELPVNDTLYEVDNTSISAVLDRNTVRIGQTPQTFNRKLLEKAHQEFIGQATDDAMMVHALGEKVELIKGEANNFKITYAKDLELARIILAQTNAS